ncbi:Transcription factor bHLH83 [Acorus calamus]|uniref:Transcription factor bHLH83 n=1 Tax=Acorus calamus TaxID=4465 RepID=A0AAV9DKL4_ACOCL|nr:Transcription factor bHLH83 [Acorus calamus]
MGLITGSSLTMAMRCSTMMVSLLGMEEGLQASKRPCLGTSGQQKVRKQMQTKDPQIVAAKKRRERISERLKALQELIPNGSKVDLVTMLENAISYVKFLQLQVKVLAMDEFWPVQGGKAPEVTQVKEAIDAILSSH